MFQVSNKAKPKINLKSRKNSLQLSHFHIHFDVKRKDRQMLLAQWYRVCTIILGCNDVDEIKLLPSVEKSYLIYHENER